MADDGIAIRNPTVDDGAAIWRLVRDSGVLDLNSSYMYLLLCSHFDHTSVVAEMDGEIVGFIMSYIPPRKPDVIFVWQVGVDEKARGHGVASRLLDALAELPACEDVRFLETTVTPSNEPSRKLFRSFGRRHDAEVRVTEFFRVEHFPSEHAHEPEELFRIGPFRGESA
ncbi:MAG: diaminobutyrate acetyltransferase [Myxococcota bacterium]